MSGGLKTDELATEQGTKKASGPRDGFEYATVHTLAFLSRAGLLVVWLAVMTREETRYQDGVDGGKYSSNGPWDREKSVPVENKMELAVSIPNSHIHYTCTLNPFPNCFLFMYPKKTGTPYHYASPSLKS